MTISQIVSTTAVFLTLTTPAMAQDQDLRILALRGIMQADPDKGAPIIERMLADASPGERDRVLSLLSQSQSSRARDAMFGAVRNNANPELQRAAIRHLRTMEGADDREVLADVYQTTTDSSVKRAVLESYFMSGNVERTAEVANGEQDSDLRRTAIHNLGMLNQPGTSKGASDALVSLYNADSSSEIRRAIVNALFIQPNAKALVDLVGTEKDPSVKKEIVSKLSLMRTPEATNYILRLLK
jgi:hypothetical protein